MLRFFINALITAWLGFLAAATIEIHRPASLADVQGLSATDKPTAPDLLDRIEQTIWRRNEILELSETEVNHYLASSLNGKQQYPSSLLTKFECVAVSFKPGLCRVWLCWKTGERPVTAAFDFRISRD
ncbi:MAG: hypothetical protein K8R87_12110 [Verrucomicrobia bacterium]|nr:hypothetical protein [Verrucomicrobiota bacterium]